MMMKRTALAVTPATQFAALARDIVRDFENGDLSEPLKECAQIADKAFARNFAAQASPDGGPWPARKKKGTGKIGEQDAGHPLLIQSGDLFEAATSPFGRGHIEDVGRMSAEIGVDLDDVPYARAQNYGRTEINLPAREFEDLTEDEQAQCDEIMADYLTELMSQ